MPTTIRAARPLAVAVLALAAAACSGEPEAAGETPETRSSAAVAAETPPAGRASSRTITAEYRVKGMTCGGCAIATEMAVKKLDGIASADAEYSGDGETGRATVTFDPSKVDTARIAAAIEGAGFEPSLVRRSGGA